MRFLSYSITPACGTVTCAACTMPLGSLAMRHGVASCGGSGQVATMLIADPCAQLAGDCRSPCHRIFRTNRTIALTVATPIILTPEKVG